MQLKLKFMELRCDAFSLDLTQFKVGRPLSTAINAWYGTVIVFGMGTVLKEKMGMI